MIAPSTLERCSYGVEWPWVNNMVIMSCPAIMISIGATAMIYVTHRTFLANNVVRHERGSITWPRRLGSRCSGSTMLSVRVVNACRCNSGKSLRYLPLWMHQNTYSVSPCQDEVNRWRVLAVTRFYLVSTRAEVLFFTANHALVSAKASGFSDPPFHDHVLVAPGAIASPPAGRGMGRGMSSCKHDSALERAPTTMGSLRTPTGQLCSMVLSVSAVV